MAGILISSQIDGRGFVFLCLFRNQGDGLLILLSLLLVMRLTIVPHCARFTRVICWMC